ncbi:MAG: nicotinate (nicotinamide) nucleotide adenylyltransferase [Deltaproteobacteria bacterium]|nr:nicotinate (nicotinamide) nucleotide adenylyltransferase [Deltaproteobacteria bacterium]
MNPKRQEVAVFGGSFNPPHLAHTLVVAYVLSAYPIKKLLVVPTYLHPFAKRVAPYEHRVRMCELAMADVKRVQVSRIEEDLGGESLTLKTLETLQQRHPRTRFRLVVGSDILAEAPRWFRFDRIEAIAPLIVLARGGYSEAETKGLVFPAISSSEIRGLLSNGLSTEGYLSDSVAAYIKEHDLYR